MATETKKSFQWSLILLGVLILSGTILYTHQRKKQARQLEKQIDKEVTMLSELADQDKLDFKTLKSRVPSEMRLVVFNSDGTVLFAEMTNLSFLSNLSNFSKAVVKKAATKDRTSFMLRLPGMKRVVSFNKTKHFSRLVCLIYAPNLVDLRTWKVRWMLAVLVLIAGVSYTLFEIKKSSSGD